jgi:hypothetical protein
MSDKKKFKHTKVGGFLSKIAPELFKTGLGLASGFLPDGGLLQKLSDKIRTSSEIDAEQKVEALSLLTLDVQDRADARAMQVAIATSEHSTLLAKNFIYYLAAFWSVVSVVYLFCITFMEIANVRAADTILGFLLGTIVATIIAYFFGSSKGSSDKMKELFKLK